MMTLAVLASAAALFGHAVTFSSLFTSALAKARASRYGSRVIRQAVNMDDDDDDFEPGDRVRAQYHADNQYYPGIVLRRKEGGRYDISWDEPDENEPITTCTDVDLIRKRKAPMEPRNWQLYHVGDKVNALFLKDNGWYEAELLEQVGEEWKIRWKDPDGEPPEMVAPERHLKLLKRAKSAC